MRVASCEADDDDDLGVEGAAAFVPSHSDAALYDGFLDGRNAVEDI